MVVMSVILETWVALAFFCLMPVTGLIVYALHRNGPRRLLVDRPSDYNRLVLNRPLEPRRRASDLRAPITRVSHMALRVLILGQWAMALAAAALVDWNAYCITFWVVVCITTFAYAIPPEYEAREWTTACGLKLTRFRTVVSSRRALLNAIIGLNPDSFAYNSETEQDDRSVFAPGALRWVDPILKDGPARIAWEVETRRMMADEPDRFEGKALDAFEAEQALLAEPDAKYTGTRDYWKDYIPEGMYVAAKMRRVAKLSGRRVIRV